MTLKKATVASFYDAWPIWHSCRWSGGSLGGAGWTRAPVMDETTDESVQPKRNLASQWMNACAHLRESRYATSVCPMRSTRAMLCR